MGLLGVLNKMGSILCEVCKLCLRAFARCVKQDGFYTIGLSVVSVPYVC